MPIYRYRCGTCGAQEEHLQKVSDPAVERCSTCGGALAKQMTAASFHLKGGGWYKDLYASSGKSGDASGGSTSTSGESSTSTASSTSDSGSSSSSGTSTPGTSTPAPSTPSSTPTPSGKASSAA